MQRVLVPSCTAPFLLLLLQVLGAALLLQQCKEFLPSLLPHCCRLDYAKLLMQPLSRTLLQAHFKLMQ